MLFYHCIIVPAMGGVNMETRGQFGDQFGGINAFVSALGFVALVVTLYLQARAFNIQSRSFTVQLKELNQQSIALNLQLAEFQAQKEEMSRSASAQEDSNKTLRLQIEELFNLKRGISKMTAAQDMANHIQYAQIEMESAKYIVESSLRDPAHQQMTSIASAERIWQSTKIGQDNITKLMANIENLYEKHFPSDDEPKSKS